MFLNKNIQISQDPPLQASRCGTVGTKIFEKRF